MHRNERKQRRATEIPTSLEIQSRQLSLLFWVNKTENSVAFTVCNDITSRCTEKYFWLTDKKHVGLKRSIIFNNKINYWRPRRRNPHISNQTSPWCISRTLPTHGHCLVHHSHLSNFLIESQQRILWELSCWVYLPWFATGLGITGKNLHRTPSTG